MNESIAGFRAELRVPPKVAVVVLVALGFVFAAVSDSLDRSLVNPAEELRVRLFSLVCFALAAIVWVLDVHRPRLSRWFAVLASSAIVYVAHSWLGLSGFLMLAVIPMALAAALVGPPAAVVMAVAETLYLVLAPADLGGGTGWPMILVPLITTWTMVAVMFAVYHRIRECSEWVWEYLERTQRTLEEVHNQRIEFKQIQDDLVHANQELARFSERLKAMHQLAEEARRAKEEFVANVSHELRTPLNMIIGFSEMITQSPHVYGMELPSSLLSDIAAIRRNSQHLSKLVDDVLDLSQVEAGRMTLGKEWISLDDTIQEATLIVQALYDSKELYLETQVTPDLPQVFCDGTRIRQVLINLLSNSGRFTERGGVQVRAWQQGNDVMVSVIDSGPGIPKADQERLFQPFEQLDNSIRRRHGGSGLGLSISKRFVELHRGRMWLNSDVGAGTEICFTLPLGVSPTAPSEDGDWKRWFSPYDRYEARTRRSKATAPSLPPRFVFLDKGDALKRLLDHYARDVETVSVQSLEQAFHELNRLPAQALIVNAFSLTDVLASMNRLTDLPYGTPAIALWMPGEEQTTQRLGVMRYLVKPVTREILLSTLQNLGQDVKSVLLVDDNAEVLRLFARMLSSAEHDYHVLRAKTGQRALGLLRERKPDVMVLDLLMSGMSGFQVLQEKSQDSAIREIPVVVITAQDPTGEPIMSDMLIVTRGGGLSVPDVLTCIKGLSGALSPAVQSGRREYPGMSAG